MNIIFLEDISSTFGITIFLVIGTPVNIIIHLVSEIFIDFTKTEDQGVKKKLEKKTSLNPRGKIYEKILKISDRVF